MVRYEDALATAKKLNNKIDSCTEYENGYVFSRNSGAVSYGGPGAPVVIMKKTGMAVAMPYFVMLGTGREIKTFKL